MDKRKKMDGWMYRKREVYSINCIMLKDKSHLFVFFFVILNKVFIPHLTNE